MGVKKDIGLLLQVERVPGMDGWFSLTSIDLPLKAVRARSSGKCLKVTISVRPNPEICEGVENM